MYVTCNYMYLSILYTFIRIYIPAPPSRSAKSSIFVARHFPRKLMIQDRVLCTCSDFLFPLSYPYLLSYRPHSIFARNFFANWYYLSTILQIKWQTIQRHVGTAAMQCILLWDSTLLHFGILFFHFIKYSFYMLKIIFRYACSNL